ncbi:hypothetical protein HK105_207731 [Polyrhizophydium stewartii]|uniref:Zn(2)-C6 fungal-type domain-containing protein n=1 Tax=Polyrhizophydium stewartii TaxID=2732419 RepID=A0ABR4MZS8_9FUNG
MPQKRKCDRAKPACAGCVMSKTVCLYAPQLKDASLLSRRDSELAVDDYYELSTPPRDLVSLKRPQEPPPASAESPASPAASSGQLGIQAHAGSPSTPVSGAAAAAVGTSPAVAAARPTSPLALSAVELLPRLAQLEEAVGRLASAARFDPPRPQRPPTKRARHGEPAAPAAAPPLPALVANARPAAWTPDERAFIERDDLIESFLRYLAPHGLFMSREFLLECIVDSRLLELAIKSLTLCIFCTAQDFDNTASIARRLHADALVEAGRAVRSPTIANALGFHAMVFCAFLNEHEAIMRWCSDVSARFAIDLKFNDELALRAMPTSETRRNDYRCVWFGICQNDWLFSIGRLDETRFGEELQLVCYPHDIPLHSSVARQASDEQSWLDRRVDVELAANSAAGYFIPPVPGRGVLANMLAIERLIAKISDAIQSPFILRFVAQPDELDLPQHELDLRVMSLEASLDGWLQHTPDEIRLFEQRAYAALVGDSVVARPPDIVVTPGSAPRTASPTFGSERGVMLDDAVAWRPFIALGMYYTARMLLHSCELDRVLREAPHLAYKSRAFRISLSAALSFARLVDLLIAYGSFSHVGPLIGMHIAHIGVFFTAAKHLVNLADSDKEQVVKGLKTAIAALGCMGKVWVASLSVIHLLMLEHLDTLCDPAEIFRQARSIQTQPRMANLSAPGFQSLRQQENQPAQPSQPQQLNQQYQHPQQQRHTGQQLVWHREEEDLPTDNGARQESRTADKSLVQDDQGSAASAMRGNGTGMRKDDGATQVRADGRGSYMGSIPLWRPVVVVKGVAVQDAASISPSMHPPAMSLSGSHSSAASHAHHAHRASHHAREHQGLHQGPHHVGMSVLLAASADAAADLGDRGGEAGGTAFTGQSGYRGYPGLAAGDE